MAEKADKKPPAAPAGDKKDAGKGPAPAAAAAAAPAAGGSKLSMLGKTPILIGGVMIVEAVVLFAGVKFLGTGAKNANGADLTIATQKTDAPGADGDKNAANPANSNAEIELLDSRFPNKQSGRTFLYDVNIYISVKADKADQVKKMIADRDALIKDRVRTIIAQSDPDKLGGGSEPGLETLRRQVKYQLDDILGDGLVEEVLVPRCIPFRTDY